MCWDFFERLQKHSWKSVCQESSKRCFCEHWKLAYEKNIKHCILIRRRFCRVLKPLHLMFYRPLDNLVPRVLTLFGQRLVARRDSGEFKKFNFLIGCPIMASFVLPQKSCGNKIPVPESLLVTNRWSKRLRTLGMRLTTG